MVYVLDMSLAGLTRSQVQNMTSIIYSALLAKNGTLRLLGASSFPVSGGAKNPFDGLIRY